VGPLMARQLGTGAEAAPALGAVVGSLADVSPPVLHQLRAALEGLLALVALVGPLSGMDAVVDGQR